MVAGGGAGPALAQVPTNSGSGLPTYSSAPSPVVTPNQNGKVVGLNDPVYRELASLRMGNPSVMTEAEAHRLKAAVLKDGRIDDIERDLLEELVQTQFRSITITPATAPTSATPRIVLLTGASPLPAKVTCYPISGNAKRVLVDVLRPALDLNAAWGQAGPGWQAIVREYKLGPVQEARVLTFVKAKLDEEWKKSNTGNGFKPYRDLVGRLYGYGSASGADATGTRTVLYKAANEHDKANGDKVPDFLYNWIRPGGYL